MSLYKVKLDAKFHWDIYMFEFEKNLRKEKILFLKYQQLLEITLNKSADGKCSEGCIWRWTIIRAERAVCKVSGMIFRCH